MKARLPDGTTNPEYNRQYYRKNRNRILDNLLYDTYGITRETYSNLLAQQNNTCAICKQEFKLSVDHSHDTGKVRGLLCNTCNFGLGLFKDSIELLQQAINYLDRNPEA